MFKLEQLLRFDNLVHDFSTKSDGNMSFEYGNKREVIRNRKIFLGHLGIKMDKCVAMWVEHEDRVVIADSDLAGKSMLDYHFAVKADGLITNKKGLYLFLLIADCLPVIIYDPIKEVIGLVHVGWKNADINLAGKVIKKLTDLYKVKSSNLIVGFGPVARKESYIKECPVQLNDPIWKGFVHKLPNLPKYQIDFVGLCKNQLISAGVKKGNIYDCRIDSIKDLRFFSHYRDSKNGQKNQGRFACVVGLK